jgi:hypothetical protein
MARPSRKPSNLSESMSKRLNSYALAASAAGVSLLALAQPLDAEIVYTKAYRHIPPKTAFNLDLNHDGITDFIISNVLEKGKIPEGAVTVSMLGNAVKGRAPAYTASALGPDIELQPNVGFLAVHGFLLMVYSSYSDGTHVEGQWLNVKPRYLGLRFLIDGEIHMGWARLCVRCKHQECHVLLTGYAYETVANQPIITGKIHGPDVITVQDPSLGHLASGASAIPAWRTKQ